MSRIKVKGVLSSERRGGTAGYRLAAEAAADFARGDRRIFSYRGQREDEPWCLVSYSLPEVDRSKRVRLRRELMGLGFGSITDGLWIAPGHLRDEVEATLETIEVRDRATIFITETPLTAEPFAQAAARWWDLDRLAARHTEFLDRYGRLIEGPGKLRSGGQDRIAARDAASREAFVLWLGCVDDWKTIPFVDPGLPAGALPDDWPGSQSVELFARLRDRLAGPARDFVAQAVRN